MTAEAGPTARLGTLKRGSVAGLFAQFHLGFVQVPGAVGEPIRVNRSTPRNTVQ